MVISFLLTLLSQVHLYCMARSDYMDTMSLQPKIAFFKFVYCHQMIEKQTHGDRVTMNPQRLESMTNLDLGPDLVLAIVQSKGKDNLLALYITSGHFSPKNLVTPNANGARSDKQISKPIPPSFVAERFYTNA